jgi:hypothetical protein
MPWVMPLATPELIADLFALWQLLVVAVVARNVLLSVFVDLYADTMPAAPKVYDFVSLTFAPPVLTAPQSVRPRKRRPVSKRGKRARIASLDTISEEVELSRSGSSGASGHGASTPRVDPRLSVCRNSLHKADNPTKACEDGVTELLKAAVLRLQSDGCCLPVAEACYKAPNNAADIWKEAASGIVGT